MKPHELVHWHVTEGTGFATVKSGKSGRLYTITATHDGSETCTCEAGRRLYGCSHVRAAREILHQQLQAVTRRGPQDAPASQDESPLPAPTAAPSDPGDYAFERIDARLRSEAKAREAQRFRPLTPAEEARLQTLLSEN
jgi:hypothetical protein